MRHYERDELCSRCGKPLRYFDDDFEVFEELVREELEDPRDDVPLLIKSTYYPDYSLCGECAAREYIESHT